MPDNDSVCTTGLWVDTKTGQVVESRPEEGIQLCPPGGELSPDVKLNIDMAREAAPVVEKPAKPAAKK